MEENVFGFGLTACECGFAEAIESGETWWHKIPSPRLDGYYSFAECKG